MKLDVQFHILIRCELIILTKQLLPEPLGRDVLIHTKLERSYLDQTVPLDVRDDDAQTCMQLDRFVLCMSSSM